MKNCKHCNENFENKFKLCPYCGKKLTSKKTDTLFKPCPICKEGEVTEFKKNEFACSKCNAVFINQGKDKYKLDLSNSLNDHRYDKKALKKHEWERGLSDRELKEFEKDFEPEKTKLVKKAGTVKHRNIILVYLFSIITLGIYCIYWWIKTKNEMNSLGAEIPTALLLLVPIIGPLYWHYKYCEGFATQIKKDDNTVLWYLVTLIVPFVMPAIVQLELNKIVGN